MINSNIIIFILIICFFVLLLIANNNIDSNTKSNTDIKNNNFECEDQFTDRYIYNDYPYAEYEFIKRGDKFADIIRY